MEDSNIVIEQPFAQAPEILSMPSDFSDSSNSLFKNLGSITSEELSARVLNQLPPSVRSRLKGESDIKAIKKRLQSVIDEADAKVNATKQKSGLDIEYALIGFLFAMAASFSHMLIMYFIGASQGAELKELEKAMEILDLGERQINSATEMFEVFCDDFGLPTLPPKTVREVAQEAINFAFQECKKEIADKNKDKDKEEQQPGFAPV